MSTPNTCYLSTIKTSPEAADSFAALLESYGDSVSIFEEDGGKSMRVDAIGFEKPDAPKLAIEVELLAKSLNIAAPDFKIEQIPADNWLARSYAGFQPFQVGRFYVHGSHVSQSSVIGRQSSVEDRRLMTDDCIPLQIDAGEAFGSGEHGTTKGCLMAIEELYRNGEKFANVLDMGCGSAILAIAVAKLWKDCKVAAVEIEEAAAKVAAANVRDNGVESAVTAVCGDGYADPLVQQRKPFDLIIANILAKTLCEMAGDLSASIKPLGKVILSGILESQADEVIAAHTAHGLHLEKRIQVGEWVTLVLQKSH